MGFDWAHTISSISKLILRSARNADDGGSGDSGSKDNRFESICSEFNHNKLMKKYQGYAQNEKFKVGLNGKTVYIFDNDENELARFQDAPYMYRGKFIPNTNTLVVKSTAGWLLFYDLDNLALIKKIRFSNIGSQTKNFAITQDGKYLYNIESPNYSTRTQLTKYDLGTLKPVITSFHNSETIFLEYVEISNEIIFLFGFMRNDKGIKDYGFIGQYKEIGEKCVLRDGKRIADAVYEKISQYKGCEDFGFTQKSLGYNDLEKIEDLEPYTLSGVYQDIIENNKARGHINNEKIREESSFYEWLEDALKKLPSDVDAINFNLYEDGNNKWSVELVGTSTFDENSSDWACNEVYTTRDNPYVLTKKSDWKAIENLFTTFLLNYLERGKYAYILKECRGIGIGFVDGDLSILYEADGVDPKRTMIINGLADALLTTPEWLTGLSDDKEYDSRTLCQKDIEEHIKKYLDTVSSTVSGEPHQQLLTTFLGKLIDLYSVLCHYFADAMTEVDRVAEDEGLKQSLMRYAIESGAITERVYRKEMEVPIEDMKRFLDGILHIYDEGRTAVKMGDLFGIVTEAENRLAEKKNSVAP